ncbi:MAG: hypothetical protein WC205_19560 [Opitutaceae bacterium]|jgi:alpha-tubulin suppressor-like RCC1 family protein
MLTKYMDLLLIRCAGLWASGVLFVLPAVGQTTPASGAIALGADHSLVVLSDGTLKGWGGNNYGQIGDNSQTDRSSPVGAYSISTVAIISAGKTHTLSVKTNGTVWAWGNNTSGQIGDNTTTLRKARVQVTTLSSITSVAAGGSHSLARKSDGTVWAWGGNANGQVGNGTTTNRLTPVQLSGLSAITSVAAGDTHSLALKSDGTVWAWGDNSNGQLGDGTITQRLAPIQITGLTNVVEISAGTKFSVARKSDGTVWAWGINDSGQLGDGTTVQRTQPTQVFGFTGATLICAGDTHVVALGAGGVVWGWGSNTQGELASTLPLLRTEAAPLFGIPAAVALGAGSHRSGLVDSNGGVRMWGANQNARLGNTTVPFRTLPVTLTDTKQVTSLYVGGNQGFIQRINGKLLAWGSNDYGQLGTGNLLPASVPSPVYDNAIFRNTTTIAVGARHTLMLTFGMVVAMGDNSNGQLGDGTTNANIGVWLTGLGNSVKAITAGDGHSFAIKQDGTVWAWGKNNRGQLGDGTTVQRLWPVQIPSLTGVVALAAGAEHSLALKSDGTVLAWGANTSGQVGDSTTTDRLSPVAVSGLTGVVSIAAGRAHSMARTSANRVWTWGDNAYGQIGNNTTTNKLVPYLMSTTTVTGIAAGADHNIILLADGSVRTWGRNQYGQVATGATANRLTAWTPVLGVTTSPVVAVAANTTATYALLADGSVAVWGDDQFYQLGYSANRPALLPLRLRTPTGFTDTNKNGISDTWENAHVNIVTEYAPGQLDGYAPLLDANGNYVYDDEGRMIYYLSTSYYVSALSDSDLDGLLDIEEYDRNSNPWALDTDGDSVGDFADSNSTDTLNADSLSLVALGGDYQFTAAGAFNAEALDAAVWSLDGNTPLVARPSIFKVLNGGGKLAVSSSGSPVLSDTLPALTDVDGSIQAFFRQPATANVVSYIRVQAGAESFDFFTRSLVPQPPAPPTNSVDPLPALDPAQVDSDGDGIPDSVETAAGLNPNAPAQPLIRNQTLPHPDPGDTAPASSLRFLTLTPALR